MLLIIGIVGTTVAPWQLFFQQSYVIDKRITPRFIGYEKVDLWIGIVIVVIGAGAMMAFSAAAFGGTRAFGHFTDAGGVADGLGGVCGQGRGGAVRARADRRLDHRRVRRCRCRPPTRSATCCGLRHSLHRGQARPRASTPCSPGSGGRGRRHRADPRLPAGVAHRGVQTLAGVLLPSATVFLLLLCNDREVLGPWVNGRALNIFTGAVIAVLVMLSIILTAAVRVPRHHRRRDPDDPRGGWSALLAGWLRSAGPAGAPPQSVPRRPSPPGARVRPDPVRIASCRMNSWRMPPLALLTRPTLYRGAGSGSPCCAATSSSPQPWSSCASSNSPSPAADRPATLTREALMTTNNHDAQQPEPAGAAPAPGPGANRGNADGGTRDGLPRAPAPHALRVSRLVSRSMSRTVDGAIRGRWGGSTT